MREKIVWAATPEAKAKLAAANVPCEKKTGCACGDKAARRPPKITESGPGDEPPASASDEKGARTMRTPPEGGETAN